MGTNHCVQNPKSLRTLATNVKFPCGNTMLHQFVLDNSHPNKLGSAGYMNAVLISMHDVPSDFVNALNNGGKSALDLAVMRNNPLMVGKLLSCLPNINVDVRCRRKRSRLVEGDTPLHLAADLGYLSVVRKLLDHGAATDTENKYRETALCYAARSGHLEVMKLLVSKGAEVNPIGPLMSPLCHAVNSGDWRAVVLLVTSGADVHPRDGWLPLCCAVRSGHLAIAELLVNRGADVNAKEAPLALSAYLYAELSKLTLLIEATNVNPRNRYVCTALHLAAFYGCLKTVEYLVGNGAHVDARDERGETPLDYATFGKREDCALFLKRCYAEDWSFHSRANCKYRYFWCAYCQSDV